MSRQGLPFWSPAHSMGPAVAVFLLHRHPRTCARDHTQPPTTRTHIHVHGRILGLYRNISISIGLCYIVIFNVGWMQRSLRKRWVVFNCRRLDFQVLFYSALRTWNDWDDTTGNDGWRGATARETTDLDFNRSNVTYWLLTISNAAALQLLISTDS